MFPLLVQAQAYTPVETLVATSTAPLAVPEEPKSESYDCSCVVFVRSKLPSLPRMETPAYLVPNDARPRVGGAIIFEYNQWHIAYILGLEADGILIEEWNFKKCSHTIRTVAYSDPAIRGYWHPSDEESTTAALTNIRPDVSLLHTLSINESRHATSSTGSN